MSTPRPDPPALLERDPKAITGTEAAALDANADGAPGNMDAALPFVYFTPLQEHRYGADNKAGALLTMAGLMFTVLANSSADLMLMVDTPGAQRYIAAGLFFAFVGLTVATVVQAFRTISPRFFKTEPSLAFFGDVAKLSREEYIQRIEALSQEEALAQMVSYNHTLASICVEKYRQLNVGVNFFRMAFVCWLGLLALINVKGLL
jgi:hypothetical protein